MGLWEANGLAFVAQIYNNSCQYLREMKKAIPQKCFNQICPFIKNLIEIMSYRKWPLSLYDTQAIESEWDRIVAMCELFKKQSRDQAPTLRRLLKQPKGQCAFNAALSVIKRKGSYNEGARADYAEAIVVSLQFYDIFKN